MRSGGESRGVQGSRGVCLNKVYELMLVMRANSANLFVQILLGVSVSLRINMFLSCQDEEGTLGMKVL